MGFQNLKFPEGSTFLITGGAGFIGSNICEALIGMGYTVRCLDNLSTGHIENITPLMDNPRFTFLKEDIRDLEACKRATDGVDFVCNEAAWGSVPRSIEMPLLYEEINIRGTLNMMEASRQNGVKKFVYASSSSVYGDAAKLPKREGEEGELLSPYALTKRTDEEYGKLYKKLYGLDTYGLRYFRTPPGSERRIRSRDSKIPASAAAWRDAHHQWRRETEPGLHLHRQCHRGKSARLPRALGGGGNSL